MRVVQLITQFTVGTVNGGVKVLLSMGYTQHAWPRWRWSAFRARRPLAGRRGRNLASSRPSGVPPSEVSAVPRTPAGVAQGLWRLAGLVRAIECSACCLGASAVADYLGDYGALVRAAKAGERWIVQQRISSHR